MGVSSESPRFRDPQAEFCLLHFDPRARITVYRAGLHTDPNLTCTFFLFPLIKNIETDISEILTEC